MSRVVINILFLNLRSFYNFKSQNEKSIFYIPHIDFWGTLIFIPIIAYFLFKDINFLQATLPAFFLTLVIPVILLNTLYNLRFNFYLNRQRDTLKIYPLNKSSRFLILVFSSFINPAIFILFTALIIGFLEKNNIIWNLKYIYFCSFVYLIGNLLFFYLLIYLKKYYKNTLVIFIFFILVVLSYNFNTDLINLLNLNINEFIDTLCWANLILPLLITFVLAVKI